MNTAELNNLEFQTESLIKTLQHLKMENQALKQKLASHTRDHSHFKQLNTKTANKIKQIINQLKGELE
jgi:cell division protein ZapB